MENRCYGCMKPKTGVVCEHCGFDSRRQNKSHQLRMGTCLRGQYRIGRVLGQGGFGITYLGYDENLNIPVAIKEYFPTGLVTRDTGYATVITVIDNGSVYQNSLDRFLKEANILARLRHVPGIVQVLNFFAENGTAYIVMEYLEGMDLRDYIQSLGRPLTPQETFSLLDPVMDALEQVHSAGMIHRDISPDNIMILKNGGVKLLDFGTARAAELTSPDQQVQHSTEAILKHGFAPSEQYQRRGSLGPWTDVYALCATAYYCMMGQVPPDATDRAFEGTVLDFGVIPGLTEAQAAALNKGMAILPQDRYASVSELKKGFSAPPPPLPLKNRHWKWIAAAAALVLLLLLIPWGGREAHPEEDKTHSGVLRADVSTETTAPQVTVEQTQPPLTEETLPPTAAPEITEAAETTEDPRSWVTIDTKGSEWVMPENVPSKDVEYVIVPEHVRNLGADAFRDCTKLREIQLPQLLDGQVGITNSAFRGCTSLTAIAIPKGTKLVDCYAFQDCTALETVTFLGSVEKIREGAFRGCTSLREIVIPEGVYEIEQMAFENCSSLETVVLPDSLITIGWNAFCGCKLTCVEVGPNTHVPYDLGVTVIRRS